LNDSNPVFPGPNIPTPKGFVARVLQARLAHFWKSAVTAKGHQQYDILVAEARYEKFCTDFLPSLPPEFAIDQQQAAPDRPVDEHPQDPKLPLQRQILHIAIFSSIYYNFQPALLQDPVQIRSLPKYKQVLLSSQEKAIAVAALRVLNCVSSLHAMMGRSQSRFPGIIQPAFEAAVLLAVLCISREDLWAETGNICSHADLPNTHDTPNPLGAQIEALKREDCMRAVQDTLCHLQMLAEVSTLAEVGAQTLARLVTKAAIPNAVLATGTPEQTHIQAKAGHMITTNITPGFSGGEDWSDTNLSTDINMHLLDYSDSHSLPAFDSTMAFSADINWEELEPSGL
jgi:hypothetical protein